MKIGRVRIVFVALLVAGSAAAVAGGTTAVAEGGYTLEVADKEPPAEVSQDLRGQLAPKTYLISGPEGPAFEFWFVSEIPLDYEPSGSMDALETMDGAALLGLVAVRCTQCRDFRDDAFDPGLFTMRMGFQPENGDHMGTAPYDTFAILVPHKRDAELLLEGKPDHRTLVEISSEDTITEHPPIFSLQPIDEAEGEFPRLTEGGDHWKFLCIELPFKAKGKLFPIAVQFVYDGIGHL